MFVPLKKNLQHCASMHRDFFKFVFHILVVYLHKTHRNVVTFYPSLRFWSVYPPSKCKKVFYLLPFALFCLIFFYFFPYCLSNSYFSTTTTYQKYLSALFPAGRQINKPQDEEPSSSSGTLCCSLSLRLLWYRSSQTPSLCYRSAAFIHNLQYNKM